MKCSEVREALSAQLDGERSGMDDGAVARHLDTCVDCLAFREGLAAHAPLLRTPATAPAPDLCRRVLAAAGRPPRRVRVDLELRLGIAALAIAELVSSVLLLLADHGYGGEDHAGHESLSFTIAICVGMLWIARRPAYARGYLPLMGVAAGLLIVTAALDIASGRAQWVDELPHLNLVGAFVLLCLLCRRPRTRQGSPAAPAGVRPRLHLAGPPLLGRVTGLGRRVLVIGALTTAAVLIATPAWSHAVLESSNPAPDSTVKTLPSTVTLHFDEAVTTLPTSLEVYGPDGSRVDNGALTHPGTDASTIGIGLSEHGPAAHGTYLVSWRVISADSHPVSGAFTFSLDAASTAPTAPAVHPSRVVSVSLGASRWLGYLGLALLLGGLAFLAGCWPAGWESRRARRIIGIGIGAAALAAVAGLLLKGPYDAALGLSHLGNGALLREVLDSTYGRGLIARLLLLVVATVLLGLRPRIPERAQLALAGVVGVALLASYAVEGHAVSDHPRALAVAVDMAHLAAMSVWVGGLVMLVLVALRSDLPIDSTTIRRFSRVAMISVVVLVVTGSYQAWRQVGAWAALTATAYGRDLLIKIAIVAVVLAAAGVSRTWVRRSRPADLSALRRSVAVETLGAVVVLAVTSALVVAEPARTAFHPSVAANLMLGPDTVQVSAVPAGDRRMVVHLYVFGKGFEPTQPRELTATISLPSKGIGPLPVRLSGAGVGHAIGDLAVPVVGDWQLTVTVRTTAIDEYSRIVDLPMH